MADQPLTKFERFKTEVQALFTDREVFTEEELSQSRLRNCAHFWAQVGWGFVENRCAVRAAALAFTTVLALVPLLGVVMSVATAFAQRESDNLKEWINQLIERTAPQLRQLNDYDKAINSIFEYVANIQTSGLGVTAAVMLIFVVISLLGSIEATFNDIWGATRGRRWPTRVVQYWAAVTLGPMLLLSAAGFMALNQHTGFQTLIQWLTADVSFLRTLLDVMTSFFVPFLLVSLVLGAFYLLMPNTRVSWKAALIGGLVAGLLIQSNSTFSFIYARRVANDASIYGKLAGVPLFLLGVYLSWLIVLLGAQVAYVYQHRLTRMQDHRVKQLSEHEREFVALRLMTHIGQRFQQGANAPTAANIAEALDVPLGLIRQLLVPLVQTSLLVEAADPESSYTPAHPLDRITVHDILHALRAARRLEILTVADSARSIVHAEFMRIQQAEREAASAVTVQSLVDRAGPAEAES